MDQRLVYLTKYRDSGNVSKGLRSRGMEDIEIRSGTLKLEDSLRS